MRNFKNKNRRKFRNNSFDRNLKLNVNDQNLSSNLGNISDFRKKNYPRNNFNFAKLIQKYSDMAREALSSGDKILYENYMQHVPVNVTNMCRKWETDLQDMTTICKRCAYIKMH